MNLRQISQEINRLEEYCKTFLTIENLNEEERDELTKPPTPLQIKAFNAIVNECKEELNNITMEKMSGVLRLLYNIESEPFELEKISIAMEDFVNKQLISNSLHVTEPYLNSMKSVVQNINIIYELLLAKQKQSQKESKKWYVFNKNKRVQISQSLQKLSKLKKSIELQMEFDSKELVNHIINDFYNIYIFFSYIIHMSIAQEEELLTIEIANALDRYIKIINLIFNGRHLKHQDMLYYYAVYELNELKDIIYSHISQYDTSF